ncbi:MAG: DUF1835 domain-containing protein [Algicola sp.]|nr:DUF1835 domain-containing protein [Algicola sp.]
MSILHITNGDCAVELMKQAGLIGDFVPWRDILHDGPVPAGLSLAELSAQRAEFIAGFIDGAGSAFEVAQSFAERDKQFESLAQYDTIRLWFEHDLYDQLQLLQILNELPSDVLSTHQVSLICTENYLGLLSPDELLALQQFEQPLSEAHIQLASRAWQAFCSPRPTDWQDLLEHNTDVLPFLSGAVERMLQQYPGVGHGLCRVAHCILASLEADDKTAQALFGAYQASESRQYLGDSCFYAILNQLKNAEPSLVICANDRVTYSISEFGQTVLAGKANALAAIRLDRWIGGVHLTQNNLWYYDKQSGRLVGPTSTPVRP